MASTAPVVLVIEDESQIRRSLRTTLSSEGYVLLEADTGDISGQAAGQSVLVPQDEEAVAIRLERYKPRPSPLKSIFSAPPGQRPVRRPDRAFSMVMARYFVGRKAIFRVAGHGA